MAEGPEPWVSRLQTDRVAKTPELVALVWRPTGIMLEYRLEEPGSVPVEVTQIGARRVP